MPSASRMPHVQDTTSRRKRTHGMPLKNDNGVSEMIGHPKRDYVAHSRVELLFRE